MQVRVKLGLALLAAAVSGSILAQQDAGLKNNSTFLRSTGDEASSGIVQYYNPKELTVDKRVPAAGPLPLTPLDRPVVREPGKVEIPNVQAVRPVPRPPAPAAGWPAKIQGPTMVDIAGDKRRAPAKIDAITIKQK